MLDANDPRSAGFTPVTQTMDARQDTIMLPASSDKGPMPLQFLRFGTPGARPKAYLQAGLHADELPGMLVLKKLATELTSLLERGAIKGEVVLAPVANPIGLSQTEGGYLVGRVERPSNRNFNRGFPDLFEPVKARVADKIADDTEHNVKVIRKAIRKTLEGEDTSDAFSALQIALMKEAADADIVLDLHADNEALLHLYTGAAIWPAMSDLAAEIDARAVLLSDGASGGNPFDEACGSLWPRLVETFPNAEIPLGCHSATVELRSNNHVTAKDSDRDARALLRFLQRRGVVEGDAGSLPRLLCEAHPLTAMQQVRAPVEGLVVYTLKLGDTVRVGDLIAEVVPPFGEAVRVEATTEGTLFARHDQNWAWAGKVIGKVAGREPLSERSGHLLTD